jgi:hypothetical protein
MITFDESQFTHTRTGWCDHWITEASDLRLAPGVFPRAFTITGVDGGVFYNVSQSRDGAQHYEMPNTGKLATIFND